MGEDAIQIGNGLFYERVPLATTILLTPAQQAAAVSAVNDIRCREHARRIKERRRADGCASLTST